MNQSNQKKKTLSRILRFSLGALAGGLMLSGILYAAGVFPSPGTPAGQTLNGTYSVRLANISHSCPADNFIKGFDTSYNPICVPYAAPNTSISNATPKSFSEPLVGGMPGGKFGTYFNNLLNICSGNGILKGFTAQGKKICVSATDRTTLTDSPTDTTLGVSSVVGAATPGGEPTGGKFQTFFNKMFSAPCGTEQGVTGIQSDGTLACSNIPVPPCVVSSCGAPAPACGTTTYGTDNCGGSCSKSGGVCACIPDGSCSAPVPACETTSYGTDNCGGVCSKSGGPCSVPAAIPPSCIVSSCSAPAPACGTTTYGTDNCGGSCSQVGGTCPVPVDPLVPVSLFVCGVYIAGDYVPQSQVAAWYAWAYTYAAGAFGFDGGACGVGL